MFQQLKLNFEGQVEMDGKAFWADGFSKVFRDETT